MSKKEENLVLLREIVTHSDKIVGSDANLASEITEDNEIPSELMLRIKDKLHEALDEVGLGAFEIRDIKLVPRSDLHPEAGIGICCVNWKCKICFE